MAMEFHHLEKVLFFLSFSLSLLYNTVHLDGFIPGDGVPRGSCVQVRPGGISACPWEAVDHIPEGAA